LVRFYDYIGFGAINQEMFRHLVLVRFAFSLSKLLYNENATLSLQQASELTHNMYQIIYNLPDSKQTKSKFLNMDEKQQKLYKIINKNFQGVPTLKTGKNPLNIVVPCHRVIGSSEQLVGYGGGLWRKGMVAET
jgi:hypothetical protein